MNQIYPVIVDNFFNDPNKIHNLSRSCEYKQYGCVNFPGCLSEKLGDLDEHLLLEFYEKIKELSGLEFSLSKVDVEFQKITPHENEILNRGIIHQDIEDFSIVGVVYLNKTSSSDSGTSFYKNKTNYSTPFSFIEDVALHHWGINIRGLDSKIKKHYQNFEEIQRVESVFNRLCLYTPEMWHGQTSYGSEDRYTLRFFIKK
tara:strand:+ start:3288 stop:3890 length:603 start_codon:yes stop_codon:yes gene_type:complete